MKGQLLAFAHARAGMGGVKFSGARNARDFWRNEILEAQESQKAFGETTESQLNNLLKMFPK